ncbi:Unknown protein sequence [Pseudomonas savastanoi pv. glycinea]|uniref:Uncharacterized protein n=1 Tax=Pseudomonas savastanoi pv. glycinea TaxID=318 RepID=A0ABR5L392_PSESG|nr:Unknown protein sequence [Pseudomonas savastanoi pv. glycinea]
MIQSLVQLLNQFFHPLGGEVKVMLARFLRLLLEAVQDINRRR